MESRPVDGQTVNVWKIGRRTSFDFPTLLLPASRLPSHELLIALFAPIFFFPSSSFFRSREKIDYPGMQKKRQAIREGIIAFRNDVVL